MKSTWNFKTISIKGKEYVTINERVKAFRNLEEFEGWAIRTEILDINSESVVVKATILDKDGNILATGHAQEDRSSSMINKTSYVENCETSAVGRALGMLGIGIENSIATYDEVNRAIKAQEAMEVKATEDTTNAMLKVSSCKSVEELEHVWKANAHLHANSEFKSAVIMKKGQLCKQ